MGMICVLEHRLTCGIMLDAEYKLGSLHNCSIAQKHSGGIHAIKCKLSHCRIPTAECGFTSFSMKAIGHGLVVV